MILPLTIGAWFLLVTEVCSFNHNLACLTVRPQPFSSVEDCKNETAILKQLLPQEHRGIYSCIKLSDVITLQPQDQGHWVSSSQRSETEPLPQALPQTTPQALPQASRQRQVNTRAALNRDQPSSCGSQHPCEPQNTSHSFPSNASNIAIQQLSDDLCGNPHDAGWRTCIEAHAAARAAMECHDIYCLNARRTEQQ
jgi:hypothetical protein